MWHPVMVNPREHSRLLRPRQHVPSASSSAASTRVSCTSAFLLCPFALTALLRKVSAARQQTAPSCSVHGSQAQEKLRHKCHLPLASLLLVLQAKSTPPFLKSLTDQGQINSIIYTH